VTPPTGPASSLALLFLLLTVGYLLTCWIWPFGNCRRCHGEGKTRSPLGRAYRICRRCNGTGLRLRAGRHLANWARRHRRDRRPDPGPRTRPGRGGGAR
jgi:hypothetical protein